MKTLQETTKQMILKLTNNKRLKLFLLGLILIGFHSCDEAEPKQMQCSILIDVTGSNTHSLQNFKSSDVLNILDLENNSQNAIEYRQAFITETFLNFTNQIKLEKAPSKMMGNDFDRDEEIIVFKTKLDESLSLISQEMGGRQYSNVYVPFASEVNRMSLVKADTKILVLVSDLTENSEFLSFFAKNFKNDLQKSPKMIEEYFQKELPLADDLSGLTIYIVHQPIEQDNVVFKKLSRVYRSMLEKRGAKVIVQANLMK